MTPLRVALAKGRLYEPSVERFRRAGAAPAADAGRRNCRPRPPIPMWPKLMRSLGAGWAKTLEGTISKSAAPAAAPPVLPRN